MEHFLPVIFTTPVKKEWLDYNDHMNVAYYTLVFDLAGEAFALSIGLGEEFTRETGISWMVLESHITYDNEVTLGQEVEVRMQLVDHDHKRMHFYFEMHVTGNDGYLASTQEQMIMCVDLTNRRSAPFPEHIRARIEGLAQQHNRLERPQNIGRRIAIRS